MSNNLFHKFGVELKCAKKVQFESYEKLIGTSCHRKKVGDMVAKEPCLF